MVHPSQLTPVQRLLLAISLPITLVFFYFLFRRSDDEEDEEADARVVTSRQTTIEVKVPHDSIGAVIGVQGTQIKMIRNTTKARLNFKDKDTEFGKDRILIIQGTQEGAQKAELMVRQIIADQPEIVTTIVQVPNYSVGRIIGRNGETIRSISHQSKAKVNVERNELRDPNALIKVELKGTPIAVDVAKMLVLEKIEAENMSQKKPSVRTEQTTLDSSRKLTKGDDTFVEVYVSAVEHPGHFWVQYLDRNAVNLTKLVYDMTVFYGEFDRPCGEDVEPVVGDLVAAPFSEDDSWYRACILGVVGDGVDVYFVDYGDSLLVSKQAIRKLSDEFKELPFQAKECCLAGIQPSNGKCWCEEAIVAFEDLVHVAKWKALMSRVIGSSTSGLPQLQLVDTNGEKDVDVAEELVRLGLAIRSSENAVFSSRYSIVNQVALCN